MASHATDEIGVCSHMERRAQRLLGFLTLNSVVAPDAWSNPISWGVLAAFALLSALRPPVCARLVWRSTGCFAVCVRLSSFGRGLYGQRHAVVFRCSPFARSCATLACFQRLSDRSDLRRLLPLRLVICYGPLCGRNDVVRRCLVNAFRLGLGCSFGLGCVFLCPGSSCWQRPAFGCRFAGAAFDVEDFGGLGCRCCCFARLVCNG